MREAELLRLCLDYLALVRVPGWRTNSGRALLPGKGGKVRPVQFTGAKGCSDILGLIPPAGSFLTVETKVHPYKPTRDQLGFLERVNAAGGLGLVVYDLAELQQALQREGIS